MDTTVCDGSSVILSATGGNFLTWNNGVFNNIAFTPTSTATYTVTGTNGFNCAGTDSVVVTVSQSSSSTLNINAMDQYVLNGMTYTTSGTYTQTIPNSIGCDSVITLVLQLDFTGLNEFGNEKISWYPNPTIDQLNILVNPEVTNSQVRIYNIKGELVKIAILKEGLNELDVQSLPSGEYLCTFDAKDNMNFRWIKK
jgi:hypothetical protein